MIPRHVTLLSAIFVSHLLLGCVESAPNAALLKMIAAKQSHDTGALSPASSSLSYVNDYNPRYPSDPSPDDDDDGDDDDVSDLWLGSAETNPMLMRARNSLTSAGSPAAEEEAGEGSARLAEASKRFHPSAFFGSRGKRLYDGLREAYAKRFFQQGFIGSRGKRLPSRLLGAEEDEEEEAEEEEGKRMAKRFNPSVFTGVRGKRYLPGLEALFLSQMYKKLDAEKWKRQSLLGFHAARG